MALAVLLCVCTVFVLMFLGLGWLIYRLRPRSFRLSATLTHWFRVEVEIDGPTRR